MPNGELLVYGSHDQAIAQADYDGNLDRPHPLAEDNELERYILLNNNRSTTLAWHGERKPQYDHFDNGRRLGFVSWAKAVEVKKAKAERRKRKNQKSNH